MTISIYLPFKSVAGPAGVPNQGYAPVIDQLPLSPVNGDNVVVLGQDVGSFIKGVYYYGAPKRWQFALPYTSVANNLYGIAEAYLCLTFTGDTHLNIGSVGAAVVSVYRNGVKLISGWTASATGIELDRPASLNDYYVVGLASTITATSSSGSGDVPEVPNDGKNYVRGYGLWSDVNSTDMVISEGTY